MTSLNKNKDGVRLIQINLNMLYRLRRYDTDTRESTFNYDGTKRFGDFDDGWKRYHWCKSQFLGYEDDTNTYYIVPDIHGSTKVIFTHAGTIVNRLDYDTLGKIRNQDASPQVELLWRGMYFNSDSQLYFDYDFCNIIDPDFGKRFGGISSGGINPPFIPLPDENVGDNPLNTVWNYIVGGAIIGGVIIGGYWVYQCENLHRRRRTLINQINTMNGLSDAALREAQAALYDFSSYNAWADWADNERDDINRGLDAYHCYGPRVGGGSLTGGVGGGSSSD